MLAKYKFFLDKLVMGLLILGAIWAIGRYFVGVDAVIKTSIQTALAAVLFGLLPPQAKAVAATVVEVVEENASPGVTPLPDIPRPPPLSSILPPPPVVTEEEITK